MRIANLYSLPIMLDTEVSIFLCREVLVQCKEEFEWYASNRKPLKLQLSPFDVFAIKKLQPQPKESLEIKLAATIENLLLAIKMPYILFPIMGLDRSRLVFYSRVAYRLEV